jgi:uncharacterized cupredoxin-like copper-binding protein
MHIAGFKQMKSLLVLVSAALLMVAMQASGAEKVEVTVEAKTGFKFEPSTLEIPEGAEVVLTFKNSGVMAHNFEVPSLDVATKTIGAGKTETVTFTASKKGSYKFICTVPGHAPAGMTGQIAVR